MSFHCFTQTDLKIAVGLRSFALEHDGQSFTDLDVEDLVGDGGSEDSDEEVLPVVSSVGLVDSAGGEAGFAELVRDVPLKRHSFASGV